MWPTGSGAVGAAEELARRTHVLIGVIVAAHNEAAMLSATLAALVRLAAFIPQLSRRWLSEVLPIVAR
jgi:hypothetical protein